MNFRNPQVDQPLLTELTSNQVVTQAEWNSWAKPDEGNLTEAVVANRDRIRERAWIYWLVKRHAMVRVPNPEPDSVLLDSLDWPPTIRTKVEFYGLYPLWKRSHTASFVALRPDVRSSMPELLDWIGARRYHLFALAPRELTSWRASVRL